MRSLVLPPFEADRYVAPLLQVVGASVYDMDLSDGFCSCPGVLSVACKHILAVAMCLPAAAAKVRINCETIGTSINVSDEDKDLTAYLEERAQLREEDKPVEAAGLPSSSSAAAAAVSAAPVCAPFLEDHEGVRIHVCVLRADTCSLLPLFLPSFLSQSCKRRRASF